MLPRDRIVVVHVFEVDRDQIHRGPDGLPRIDGDTSHYRLYLASSSDAGGWLLETWREHEGQNQRRMGLMPDLDTLTDDIADAVRHIATSEE